MLSFFIWLFLVLFCLTLLAYLLYKIGPVGWAILFLVAASLFAGVIASFGYLPAEKYGYGGDEGRQKILEYFPDAKNIPDDAEAQRDMHNKLWEQKERQRSH